jgi:hypothetical protein
VGATGMKIDKFEKEINNTSRIFERSATFFPMQS